jgi:hypothetical protein
VLTKHVSAQELQSQLENLDMCDLDRHPELRSQLDNAEALYIASVLSAADDVSNRSLPRLAGLKEQKDNSITMPWKPKYTAAISALQLVAANVLLTPAKAQGSANGSSEVVKHDDHSLLWTVLMFVLLLYALYKLCKELLIDVRWITGSVRSMLLDRFPIAEPEPDPTSTIRERVPEAATSAA